MRKPAVEDHFLLTEVPPLFQRGEIQESEVDGFLYLVSIPRRKRYIRDVRLE